MDKQRRMEKGSREKSMKGGTRDEKDCRSGGTSTKDPDALPVCNKPSCEWIDGKMPNKGFKPTGGAPIRLRGIGRGRGYSDRVIIKCKAGERK